MLFDEQTPVASPLPVLEQDCLSDYRDSLNNNYNHNHNYNNNNYNNNNNQHLTIASAPSSYHSSFSSGASLSLEALLIEHGLLQPTAAAAAAAAATTSPQLHYLETGPQYSTFMSPGTTYQSIKSPSPMEQYTVVSQYMTAPRFLASSPTSAIAAPVSAATTTTEKSTRKSSKSTPMEEPGMDIVHHAMKTPINPNLRIQRRSSSAVDENINTGSQTDAKPVRFHPTPCELQTLVGVFEVNPFPSRVLREKLAQHMGITMRQIQLWFQNRRAFKKAAGLTFTRPLKNTRRMSAKF
ncbi:hypothetical protein CcCBS67573_g10040 [Chytriomyces confervae]|uniref:Homeobox domain-containing protein n=1 Tax=Chytriomyces confervae TaxID=246404 RepID=A0A507DJ64_9FUNG|nr:hypothetical protein CcCBS67573_g10040 [Chytriomyces confervae]